MGACRMKAMRSDWYKKIWTLDIQNQSWTEDTKRQVDFVIQNSILRAAKKFLILPAVTVVILSNLQDGDFQ